MGRKKADKALSPRVIMHSKVLSTYTAMREGVAEGIATSTMHKWVWDWWKGMFGFGKKPPIPEDDKYSFEWKQILATVVGAMESLAGKTHWGHLIVDEGQDFAVDMYVALSAISSVTPESGGNSKPAITVFADENQRLSEGSNCTIKEIDDALSLPSGRRFELRKNYRNTKQVAEFARYFYVGLPSGVPDVPSRVGSSKPRVVHAMSGIETARSRIASYARNNPDKDVGVLCMRDKVRKKIFNSVNSRLAETNIVVQTYSSYEREAHPPEELKFDQGGSVTILNAHSSKGLEFDAVFIIDPLQDNGGASIQQSKMQLYVMASRPREYLELLLLNPPSDFKQLLPDSSLYDFSQE
jgi:DNA helicase IV